MNAPRVMFWVQHLVGVGHQRRSAAIARALAGEGARVCYVSGGRSIDDLDLRGCEFVQLPSVRSLDMQYHTLIDDNERAIDTAFRAARREQLLATFERFAPHVVVTETWPFGRGLLRFELEPLMAAVVATRPRPVLISSIRDIVERREDPAKFVRMAERVEQYFDEVLVHSDAQLVDFADSFPCTARIADRLHYTGYVSEREPVSARARHRDGAVVVSAGGGFFGERLLRTALEAASLCALSPRTWTVLVGPNLAQPRFEALRDLAPSGVEVQRNRKDFHELLTKCAVSVSQGGYNTVVDLLALRVPAVVVAYEDEREHEQAVRVRCLCRHGLLRTVDYQSLTAQTLATAIFQAAQGGPMPAVPFNLDGARNSARRIIAAARRGSRFEVGEHCGVDNASGSR